MTQPLQNLLLKTPRMQKTQNNGIILLAKQTGMTSFSSLFSVKKALNTKKVGHTGTLDSFADGLLVVLAGSMTHLVNHITALHKTYQAVIAFGTETDTLDPSGESVGTAELPDFSSFVQAFRSFSGPLMQEPPHFSALHVDGKRASDLARKGEDFVLPKRPVTVFESSIREVEFENGQRVVFGGTDDLETVKSVRSSEKIRYARVDFKVSKGTYIRCLARDIALACQSRAHLIALRRTEVGNFRLCDAAGYSFLKDFSIENALHPENNMELCKTPEFHEEIRRKSSSFSRSTALLCGMRPVTLTEKGEKDFANGKFIHKSFFSDYYGNPENLKAAQLAVFDSEERFRGVVEQDQNRFKYGFVIS